MNLMFFLPAVPFLLSYIIFSNKSLNIDFRYIFILFIITFLFSYLGNKFSFLGIKHSPNPGYSLIIQKSYAIYTSIASIFLFNSELTFQSSISILIILLFSATIIIDKSNKKRLEDKKWVIYSFLSFILFGTLAISIKFLQNNGIDPWIIVFYIFTFVSIFFAIDLFKNQNFKSLKLKRSPFIFLILIGVSNGIFNTSMNLGYKTAPNIGYVNIMNTSSIVLITLLSTIFFKDKLTIEKLIGVVGVFLGLILLILPK